MRFVRWLLIFLSIYYAHVLAKDTIVYIIPHSNKAFKKKNYALRRCNALKKLGYDVKICSGREPMPNAVKIVCSHHSPDLAMLVNLVRYPKDKLILFLREPPTLFPFIYSQQFGKIFGTIYSWHDEYIAQKGYKKFFFAQRLEKISNQPNFEDKKFCCMFASNKYYPGPLQLYGARRAIAALLERIAPEDFDLYGKRWRGNVSKGYAINKRETLKQYKFCICYENSKNLPGYISEKIFDAFIAGAVPIYWGDQSTKKLIPAACYIDRSEFANDKALYNYLKTMPRDIYDSYRTAIENYLTSEAILLFSHIYFTHIFLEAIDPQYSQDQVFSMHEKEVIKRCNTLRAVLGI